MLVGEKKKNQTKFPFGLLLNHLKQEWEEGDDTI